ASEALRASDTFAQKIDSYHAPGPVLRAQKAQRASAAAEIQHPFSCNQSPIEKFFKLAFQTFISPLIVFFDGKGGRPVREIPFGTPSMGTHGKPEYGFF